MVQSTVDTGVTNTRHRRKALTRLFSQRLPIKRRRRQTHQYGTFLLLVVLGCLFLTQHHVTAHPTHQQISTQQQLQVNMGGVSTPTGLEPPPTLGDTQGPPPPPPGPKVFGIDLGQVFSDSLRWLLTICGQFLTWLIDWITGFGVDYTTPAILTYKNDTVINFHGWILGISESILALMLVITGYRQILASRSETFREWAPRLVFAAVLSASSLYLIGQIIEIHNAATVGIQGELATAGVGDLSLSVKGVYNWTSAPSYELVAYVLELCVLLVLSLQMLARIALLNLLTVLAPLGLLLAPKMWCQFFFYTLITQFLQVLVVALGSSLFAGVGHSNTSPVSWLVGIAALFLAAKIPGMLMQQLRTGLGDPQAQFAAVKDVAVAIIVP